MSTGAFECRLAIDSRSPTELLTAGLFFFPARLGNPVRVGGMVATAGSGAAAAATGGGPRDQGEK